MAEHVYFSPGQLVFGGLLVFGLWAAFGVRLLVRGLRNDVLDSSGTPAAGRTWFIAGGLLCMLPLAAFLVFAWRQGYLGRQSF